MARRDTATDTTNQRLTDDKVTPDDGHSQIVEEAPGIDPNAEIITLTGNSVLYDGIDGESIEGVDGESHGSTLLDDLTSSDLPDPTDGIDDQNSWAMDLPSGLPGYPAAPSTPPPTDGELLYGDVGGPLGLLDSLEDIEAGPEDTEPGDTAPTEKEPGPEEGSHSGADDAGGGESQGEFGGGGPEDEPGSQDVPGADETRGQTDHISDLLDDGETEGQGENSQDLPGDDDDTDDESTSQDGSGGDDDDDDDDEPESQGGDGPRESQTMPAPDDGTGGDPDADDFIGGRGDVDPPPETEDHGGGELIGGRGDVDPAPETEEQGAGELIGGRGDIDPLEGESSLLGGDTGDLAEMAAEADLGDVEIDFDDSLVDADIGEDV